MLPFTTYHIPESPESKTAEKGKKLCLVVKTSVSDDQRELLKKISSALKTEFPDDVHIVVIDENESIVLAEFLHDATKLIISFGIAPSSLGLWIDLPERGMRKLEEFTFILTYPLLQLADHPNAKQELWKWMQMFMEQS